MISKIGAVPELPFSSLSAGMKRRVFTRARRGVAAPRREGAPLPQRRTRARAEKLREIRAARRASVGNVRATISEGEKSGAKVLVAENISHTWNGVPAIRNFSFGLKFGAEF